MNKIASKLFCNNIDLIYGFQPEDNEDDDNDDCVVSPKLTSYVQEPEDLCCFILAHVFPWMLQPFQLQLNGQQFGIIAGLRDGTFVDLFEDRIGAVEAATRLVCRDAQATLNAEVFTCEGHKDGFLQVYPCERS